MGIYVCSDIHGMYDLYCRMLEAIRFSDRDHLYILGDMIDRGPDGIRILLDVMKRENVTCLLGNHEHMMWYYLNCIGDPIGEAWMLPGNGGRKTLTSYTMLPDEDRRSIKRFLDDLYLQDILARILGNSIAERNCPFLFLLFIFVCSLHIISIIPII